MTHNNKDHDGHGPVCFRISLPTHSTTDNDVTNRSSTSGWTTSTALRTPASPCTTTSTTRLPSTTSTGGAALFANHTMHHTVFRFFCLCITVVMVRGSSGTVPNEAAVLWLREARHEPCARPPRLLVGAPRTVVRRHLREGPLAPSTSRPAQVQAPTHTRARPATAASNQRRKEAVTSSRFLFFSFLLLCCCCE